MNLPATTLARNLIAGAITAIDRAGGGAARAVYSLKVGAGLAGLLMLTSCATAQADPAPWGALFSSQEALRVAFEDVCLPAVLDGRPIEAVATIHHLVSVSPGLNNLSSARQVFRLASLGRVFAVDWGDGSCSGTSEMGDPQELAASVIDIASRRDLVLNPGRTEITDNGQAKRTAYCTAGPNPVVVALTAKIQGANRPALMATVFRAKGEAPDFCRA